MSLVLHDGVGRKVEDSPQCVSDAGSRRLVAGGFVPDGDDVLLETGSRDSASECGQCINGVGVCVCVCVCSTVVPGSVLTPRHRRSPPLPWTAPPAWPESGFPSTETPGLSSGEWSTFRPSYWHHPDHNKGLSFETALSFENNTKILFHNPTTDLPHGFNALLEEVKVTMACQVTGTDHVTIETPELLHLSTDKSQHELELKNVGCVCLK